MIPPPTKKTRLLSPSLHSKILSCFPAPTQNSTLSIPSISHLPLPSLPPTLFTLCDSLTCISKHADPSPLSTLQSHLQSRFHAPSELISALFFDQDTLPPLCALSVLIRHRLIRPIEIPSQSLLVRATLELDNPQLCSCRGVYPGIEALLHALLHLGRVGERTLGALIAALFGDDQAGVDLPLKFKLARIVVDVIRKEAGEGGVADALLEEWARHVVLPKREHGGESCGRPSRVWTPELSGLATGRKVAEYLKGGIDEEKAVLALCRGVSLEAAVALFSQGVRVVVTLADGKGHVIVKGHLGYTCVLIERILDHSSSHVAPTSRTTMECSVTAALSSVHAQGDGYVMATLLCLARHLFHPKGFTAEGEKDAQGFVEHERWLKNVVRASDGPVVKAIVNALSELVSLEPVQYLRTNHRVLAANRQHLRQFGDYLVEVRAKISDLDPMHRTGSNGINLNSDGTQLPASQSRRKAELDVSRFVSEFAQSGGKIPTSLVRQMNFHRYHFRGNTLPVLLRPDLTPTTEAGVNPFMDKRAFDEHRINLIKVMAFKRRDNAVTKEEAHTAISAIKASSRNVKQNDTDDQVEPPSRPSNSDLEENQDFAYTVEFVLKRSFQKQRTCLEASGMPNGSSADMSETAVANMLERFKEELERRKEPHATAALAAETLQGILNALTSDYQHDPANSEESNEDDERLVGSYRRWWRQCGSVLCTFFARVIGSEVSRSLHRQLQHHLFALVCMRLASVTPDFGVALAQIISVVSLLIGELCLADVCYLPYSNSTDTQHLFVKTIFECLSLRDGESVRHSVRFALHSLCSFKVARDEGYLLNDRVEDANYSDHNSSTQNAADSVLYRLLTKPLLSLVQWVVTVPWRLLAHTAAQFKNSITVQVTQDAADILRTAALMLSSDQLYRHERRSLREWLKTEYRCGWGRPNSVRKVLASFQRSGMDPTAIIGEASLFLAVETTPSGQNADWILQGLLMYADATPVVNKATSGESGDNQRTLAEMVATCIQRHGAEAALRMLSTLSMRRQWYFGIGAGFDKADSHIGEYLVPTFWPLPGHCLRYVLQSLERCEGGENEGERGCTSEVLLVCNICMVWDSFAGMWEEWQCGCVQVRRLVDQARDVKRAMCALDEWSAVGHERETQMPVGMSELVCGVVDGNARMLGIGVVLQCARDVVDGVEGVEGAVRRFSGVVGGLSWCAGGESVVDVIDVGMYVAGMGPFLYGFVGGEEYEGVLECMDGLMGVLWEERVRLWGVSGPYWMRERLGGDVVAEDDYRGIVGEGFGVGSGVGEIGESVCVCVCVGRVFGRLGRLGEDEFRGVVSKMQSGGLRDKVVCNILGVYRVLQREWGEKERGKMSKLAFGRVVEYRDGLRRELLKLVRRFVKTWPGGTSGREMGMGDWLDRILVEFEECAEEVRMYVSAD